MSAKVIKAVQTVDSEDAKLIAEGAIQRLFVLLNMAEQRCERLQALITSWRGCKACRAEYEALQKEQSQ